MATFSIHPEAEARFNQEAERVLGLVERRPRQAASEGPGPRIDIHTHQVPPGGIQGPVTGGLRAHDGKDLAIFRDFDGSQVGFFDSGYSDLEKLTNRIHQQPFIRDLVTPKEVLTEFFEWSLKRHHGEISEPFLSFFDLHLSGRLTEHEVWVPINGLLLAGDLNLGAVVLRSVSRALIERWKESCGKVSKIPAPALEQKFIKDFQPIQGFAAGVAKRTGTLNRATEVAVEDVSRIVEIIRAFHYPVLRCGVRSHLALKGQEAHPIEFVFTVGSEGCPRTQQSIVGAAPMDFLIDQEQASRLGQCGVWYACSWLFRKRTALEDQILTAISLLSRSALTTDLSDRLVYVFAALESLLLQGETEPILHAVAERFAFFVADDGPGRRDLRERVRKVYGLRSRFVHHGQQSSEHDLVDQFLLDVHVFFMLLIGRSRDFESKAALLNRIDEIKLNGESFGQDYPDPAAT
jgi:hypothetical protein